MAVNLLKTGILSQLFCNSCKSKHLKATFFVSSEAAQTMRICINLFFLLLLLSSCNNSAPNADNTKKTSEPDENTRIQPPSLSGIQLPPGFSISVYAGHVKGARSMTKGDKGTIFVGTRQSSVYALVDENNDGKVDKPYTIANDLNTPNGVAFRNGSLYVAEINRILRYDHIEDRLANPPKPVVVYDKYPTDKHHGWKYIAFGPDGKLYVPVGAPCNICEPDPGRYACITRMNADGTEEQTIQRGIRNTVGFDWQPGTNTLWFTDNGRDELGDNIPPDELNCAPKDNMNFGFPYCHAGYIKDPEYGKKHNCSEYTAPAMKLGPHVAALGMKFYTGKMFPEQYHNQVFICEHGSWNRSEKIGYRISLVKVKGNKALFYEPFATGWLKNGAVSGRPVDLLILPDGSMLVSDDDGDAVYRITYHK
jgi:glucose/arabinose dehydrogenase